MCIVANACHSKHPRELLEVAVKQRRSFKNGALSQREGRQRNVSMSMLSHVDVSMTMTFAMNVGMNLLMLTFRPVRILVRLQPLA